MSQKSKNSDTLLSRVYVGREAAVFIGAMWIWGRLTLSCAIAYNYARIRRLVRSWPRR